MILLSFFSLMAVSPAAFDVLKGFDLSAQKNIQLSQQASQKYRVMVFLSAKCPCSIGHEAKLRELSKEFKAKGFQFVAIHSNADEDLKMAKEHFSEAKLGFPVINDPQSKWAEQWKALKTPHVFVVDANNKILYQGGVDDSSDAEKANENYLRDALNNLSLGQPVSVAETRALGCRIARPD